MITVQQIFRYEAGEMTHWEEIAFFQTLVNTGLAWSLQGSYGRQAQALLDAGLIHHPGTQPVEETT